MKSLSIVALAATLAAACADPSPSPAAVVTELVERARLSETEAGRRDAFDLLSRRAQEALRARATAAATATGLPDGAVAPWDVARYLRFVRGDRIASAEAVEVTGDRATVRVHLAAYYEPKGDDAEAGSDARGDQDPLVRLVREDGAWRVDLGFPPPRPAPAEAGR